MLPPEGAKYAGLGCTFAATILVFGAIGWWLDGQLGTEPWLLIVGIFLGFGGGLYSLIRKVPPTTGGTKSPPPTPPTTPRR